MKPIAAMAITLCSTIGFVLLSHSHSHHQQSSLNSKTHIHSVANNRSFIVWLHGLGSSGPANEHYKSHFTSPEFKNTVWSFPSAPSSPVTCFRKFFSILHLLKSFFVFPFLFFIALIIKFLTLIVTLLVSNLLQFRAQPN